MFIPKYHYTQKQISHQSNSEKSVILDSTHLPHLLQFAKAYFKQGQKVEAHLHASMAEVFYVNYGVVRVVLDGNSFTASCGDSFYVKAQCMHELDFLEDTELIYFNLENDCK